jgi:hypothetical protein
MTSTPVFYPLLLAALVLVCLIIHVWWPDPQKGTPSPMKPVKPKVSDPKNPKPSPDIFKSPGARPVSTAPIHLPRPLAPHRQRSSSPRADGVPWIPRDMSVPIPIAPIPAGSGALTSAPPAIPVVNPGTSFNGCRGRDSSTRPTAPVAMANGLHPTSLDMSSPVWLRDSAFEAQRVSLRSIPIRFSAG